MCCSQRAWRDLLPEVVQGDAVVEGDAGWSGIGIIELRGG